MQPRDKIMSGAYDWIIFPAALAFIAWIVAGALHSQEKTLTCEQAEQSGGFKDRLIACAIAPVAHKQ